MKINECIVIDRPAAEVFAFYRDFRNLPAFLGDVMEVSLQVRANLRRLKELLETGRRVTRDHAVPNKFDGRSRIGPLASRQDPNRERVVCIRPPRPPGFERSHNPAEPLSRLRRPNRGDPWEPANR
jgi:hypothetical protein